MSRIKETYRGWQGHFICNCRYHLNTLLELDEQKIVVSTVGMFYGNEKKPQMIGCNRYFETLVFEATEKNGFIDADVSKELFDFSRGYSILYGTIQNEQFWIDQENDAEYGHRETVGKVKEYMLNNTK